MILGIGTDIIEISRIEELLNQRKEEFRKKFFTKSEQDYCDSKRNPYPHYAVRFAAKEAVVKALGTGFRGFKFTDLEIQNDTFGRPYIILYGKAKEIAEVKEIKEIKISLSHDRNQAIAYAIAVD